MQITINIPDYLNDKSLTYWSLQKIIVTKIIDECNKYKTKKIITNGNLGSVLSDGGGLKYVASTVNSANVNYTLGTLDGIEIVIDTRMRWDDNRIILTPSLQKKRENKLKRIFREKVTNETTEIKIIDTIGILV